MAGFFSEERIKLIFKVLAANVVDANYNFQWNESKFPNNSSVTSERVLTQFATIRQNPVGTRNEALTLVGNGGALESLVQDRYSPGKAIKMSQAKTGDKSTWVACTQFNNLKTQILDWIQPQKILLDTGAISTGWAVEIWNGYASGGPSLIIDRAFWFNLVSVTAVSNAFLGWAQVWCQNITEESLRLRAATDSHSAAEFRVNGVVSNMPEFASAFACRPNQAMVKGPACRVW